MALLVCPTLKAFEFSEKTAFDVLVSVGAYKLTRFAGDQVNLSSNTKGILKSCEVSRAAAVTAFDVLQQAGQANPNFASVAKKGALALALEKAASYTGIFKELENNLFGGRLLASQFAYVAAKHALSRYAKTTI